MAKQKMGLIISAKEPPEKLWAQSENVFSVYALFRMELLHKLKLSIEKSVQFEKVQKMAPINHFFDIGLLRALTSLLTPIGASFLTFAPWLCIVEVVRRK